MGTVKLPFYAKLAFILISFILTVFILEEAKDIFIPLVFALLVSILLYPLTRFFEHRLKLGRSFSAILSITLFLAFAGAFFYFLSIQIVNFAGDMPNMRPRFQHTYNDIHHWLSYKMHINAAQQNDYINRSASSIAESAARSVSNLFLSLTSILLLTVFVFIFTFFILFHRRMLINFTINLFSEEHESKVREVIRETKSMMNSYVVGLLLEMIIMSIANSALLMIIGVPYGLLLGILAAVLNIIPYLGIYTATGLIIFFTFANSSLHLAMIAGGGMLGLHMIDSNILMPRIVGARVKMNPFITVIAVIVGEFVWGIPGMFLFIPIIGIVKLICERVEGLEAWAMLIGVDETVKAPKQKLKQPDTEDVPEAIEKTTEETPEEEK
jgi:AI-2 transport protein TqsA